MYFIPAWYQPGKWCENEQNWHTRRMYTEFDDTVKQVQLFHRSGAYPFKILLLSFAPNFRHFLHRQGVFHAGYWSCFDAIQEVKRRKPMILSFHNLNWPPHIEFVYSPFVVIAMLNGVKYAQIEFGEDGNPIQVDLYEKGIICRRNLYDDRGFVASTILYEGGREQYQDYLTEEGVWKLRQYEQDGHIEVNPSFPDYLLSYQGKEYKRPFSKMSYLNMQQVLYEVLNAYLEFTDNSDIFCAALHEQHAELLTMALNGRRVIWSLFGNRYLLEERPEARRILGNADYIITDSRESLRKARIQTGALNIRMTDISPYDSRTDINISLEFQVQKLLVPVDELSDQMFDALIQCLGKYLGLKEDVRIHLFTRKGEWNRKEQILEQTRKSLYRAGVPIELAGNERQEDDSENKLEEDEIPVITRFFVEQCVDELAVSKCMREQRLMIDLRNNPELYLQIMAISLGIPQIVRTGTQFVEDRENGIILKNIRGLQGALDYYLNGLTHWNEARIYAYEFGKRYTADKLLEAWREVIEYVGRDSHLTAGG